MCLVNERELNGFCINIKTIQKNKKTVDPLEFESRISAMSRRRHNQLDHEPVSAQ